MPAIRLPGPLVQLHPEGAILAAAHRTPAALEEVRALLEIPEPWGTAAAIPIGYPVRGGHGPISRRPVSKLAFDDTWGSEHSRPAD